MAKQHILHLLFACLLLPWVHAQDLELEGGAILRGFDPGTLRSPTLRLEDPLEALGPQAVSTAADRVGLRLTLQEGQALVDERRRLRLLPGVNRLELTGVPALSADSVQVQGVRVLEQRMHLPVHYLPSLLRRRLGEPALLEETLPGGGRLQTPVTIAGYAEGPLLRVEDRILLQPAGTLVLPAGPDAPASPTLHWLLESAGGEQEVTLSYLAAGMSWQTVLHLQLRDAETGVLGGWLSVFNETAADFEEAELRLPLQAWGKAPPDFLTLERPVSLARHQEQQIRLLDEVPVRVAAEHVVPGPETGQRARAWQAWRLAPEQGAEIPAWLGQTGVHRVRVTPGPEIPAHFPPIRALMQADGAWWLLGAPTEGIATGRNEQGAALEDGISSLAVQYVLFNDTTAPVAVQVLEQVPAGWRLVSATHPHARELEANTTDWLRFEVVLRPFAEERLELLLEWTAED